MWFFGILLLSAALAPTLNANPESYKQFDVGNYHVRLQYWSLAPIEVIKEPASNELNLAGLGIKTLQPGCFDQLTNVTHLNLANNSIQSIPGYVFWNMRNLEYLSLANNGLESIDSHYLIFKSLRNLKTLDLSNTNIPFRPFVFNGLSRSCNIITRGISINEIDSQIFLETGATPYMFNIPLWVHDSQSDQPIPIVCDYDKTPNMLTDRGYPPDIDVNYGIKICIENGIVTDLDTMKNHDDLTDGCKKVNIDRYKLHMNKMNITGFAKRWYKLQNSVNVMFLSFANNEIATITPELLNDLPSGVRVVDLKENKIEHVDRGVIDNPHLSSLVLTKNRITLVEDGAFEKLLTMESLLMGNNHLTDMNFVATLPTSMRQLLLSNNEISEIPVGIMSNLKNLFNLELHANRIEKIGNGSFPSSLEYLKLGNNRLQKLEADALSVLTSICYLDVSHNSISSVDTDAFNGLFPRTLNFSFNNFAEFPKAALSDVQRSTHQIFMNDNQIKKLEAGTFDSGSLLKLHLQNNKISEVEQGAFRLPALVWLRLDNNLLTEFDGDSFAGMNQLMSLKVNNNRIKTMRNAFKNLRRTGVLDFSNNLFTKLEVGSLGGMCITPGSSIVTRNTPIELIQPGMFDVVE